MGIRVFSSSASVLLLARFIFPLPAVAQQAPEAVRLADFVGSWTSDACEGGFECAWLGEAAVVCRSEWMIKSGDAGEALYVNPEEAEYTWHRSVRGGPWEFVATHSFTRLQ